MLRGEKSGFEGEAVWVELRNPWGYTPQELFEERDSVSGLGELYMPFWKDLMGYWKRNEWVDLFCVGQVVGGES